MVGFTDAHELGTHSSLDPDSVWGRALLWQPQVCHDHDKVVTLPAAVGDLEKDTKHGIVNWECKSQPEFLKTPGCCYVCSGERHTLIPWLRKISGH
jgi:hypothetical protein